MLNHQVILLFTILALFLTLTSAQSSPSFLPADIPHSGGRVGIVNRNPLDEDEKVNFWIAGLATAAQYLEFQAQTVRGNTSFKLIESHGAPLAPSVPIQWGKGDFVVQWGASTAHCHLEAKAGVNAASFESKMFNFLPGGLGGSYLWPCGFQDWVKVVCEGPQSSCTPGGW